MKTEIQTKLEISEILVKNLPNQDISESLTPLYEYIKEQLSINNVMQATPEKVCAHTHESPIEGWECDECKRLTKDKNL